MSDPQQYGLSELGQRVQAMSDPAPEPRLRPYQGTVPSSANGRPTPAAEPSTNGANPFAEVQVTDFRAAAAAASSPYSHYTANAAPAPDPFAAFTQPATTQNGFPSGFPSGSSHSSAPSGYSPLHGVSQPGMNQPSVNASAPVEPAPAEAPASAAPAPVDPNAPKTGLQKAVDAVRSAIPLVQRLLPLLDGNFANAITTLMAPQPGQHPGHHPAAPQVQVNLEPVERGLAEVRTSNRELRVQLQEQGTSLKRVEDQLERVREATDRNTLEQQELVEDLRSTGNRISTFVIAGIVLLLVVLGVNIYFLVQLQHILR
jgi:hypothetical protein